MVVPAVVASPPQSFGAPVWRAATHERFENTDVYVLEDGKYLYVAFDAAKADASGDGVSVYLWSDKAAYAFNVVANGARSAKCSTGAVPEWGAQTSAVENGYAVTIKIPEAMFHTGGQSRWLVQFAREMPASHVAYTWPASSGDPGNVLYTEAFEPNANGAFSAASAAPVEPAVAPAGQALKLWPTDGSPIAAPAIPSDAQGVAVAQSHDNLRFAGVEAKSKDGTQRDAQSLGWSSQDGRASAAVQRVASGNGNAYDVTQALSFAFDNLDDMRFSAGIAADRGTNVDDASQANYSFYDFLLHGTNSEFEMRWNSAGPQYTGTSDDAPAPGTNGFTLSASHDFGSVSIDAKANRYRDDFGSLADADARADITAALSPALTFGMDAAANAGTQYASLPYAQNGASLQYAADGRQAALSYHEDHYDGGLARELAVNGAFAVPVLGTIQLSHRQISTFGTLALSEPDQSSTASLQHRLRNGAVSLGYQYAGGAANVTFSFEDRLPIGLLRATYYNPNTNFSAPNFSLRLVAL